MEDTSVMGCKMLVTCVTKLTGMLVTFLPNVQNYRRYLPKFCYNSVLSFLIIVAGRRTLKGLDPVI